MRGLRKKLVLLLLTPLMSLTVSLMPMTAALAYTDGISFVNCTGRFSMGQVSLNAGNGITGTVTAYGCSNGYFYVVTKSNYPASLTAVLNRSNPWGQAIKSQSNVYQVITPMLARINGACYNVYGSINSWTGKGWRFCW